MPHNSTVDVCQMRAFRITVRTANGTHPYQCVAKNSFEAAQAAVSRHDEPCGITVVPVRVSP